MFGKVLATPEQQAQMLLDARGDVWTNIGYTQPEAMIPIANYRYRRVFPDGPFDQAWQGIQKNNPISDVYTGYAEIPNPYQRNRMKTSRILQNNPAAYSVGAGPALYQAQDEYQAVQDSQQPGLLQTILSKLKGGG